MTRIVAVGNANVDITVFLSEIPGPDEDVDADSVSLGVGGSASNFASTCALLGEKTSIVAVVGDDPLGSFYLEEMAQRGVDTRLIELRADSKTGFVIILNVAESQRRMIRYRGANLLLADDVLSERGEPLRSAEVVHTSSVRPAVVRTLIEMGLRLSWDPGWTAVSRYRGEVLELMETGQILRAFLNEKELRVLTRLDDLREGAASIHEMGVEEVVVKRGEAGSAALAFRTWYEAPALRVRAVDTTGAGDVFDGAYTVARLRGLNLGEALRAANFAAGKTVEVPGAVKGLPSWSEIRSFLSERK